jgi:hypothetical protein
LELLETESGIQPIAISRIRRQEDKQLREAVELLSLGRVKAGLDVLEKLGVFHELPDETRDKQLAQRYADAIAAGQSALVISPSNVEKDRVAAAIREELQQRGLVSRDEHQLTTLKRYEWDVAERQDPRRYHPGDVVEFRARAVGGFQAGDRVKVARVDEDRVWVEHGGAPTPLPMQAASVFSVFQPVESSFANGDLIRFTQNRGAKPGQQRLNNGDVFAIRFTKEGGIDLGNGVQFDPRQFPHFTQGLVTTSYSSQGDTKDRVFIAQSSKSFAASSPDQAYVSVSRARLGVEIYSDDVDGLKQAVSRKRPNVAAVELARDVKAEPEMSRVKRHIVRMRDAANRARITLENQLRRLAQLLPTRHDTTPSHAR